MIFRVALILIVLLLGVAGVRSIPKDYFHSAPVVTKTATTSSPCLVLLHPEEGQFFMPCSVITVEDFPLTWLAQGREA